MSTQSVPGALRPPTLRSFWHDLPREGKLLLSVVVFEFIGTGLVLPFNVVYLHEVRGFALERRRAAARRCRRWSGSSWSGPAAPPSTGSAPGGS